MPIVTIGDRVRVADPKNEYYEAEGEVVSITDRHDPRVAYVRIDGWTGPGEPYSEDQLTGPILPSTEPIEEAIEQIRIENLSQR